MTANYAGILWETFGLDHVKYCATYCSSHRGAGEGEKKRYCEANWAAIAAVSALET